MHVGDTFIENTFAEAFRMRCCRLVITAVDLEWARIAAREATGYGSSIIACDAEAGIESELSPDDTPDGRPGVAVLLFGFSSEKLEQALLQRVGQCVLTCPTTAVYDGLSACGTAVAPESAPRTVALGKQLRYFGDGFQRSKVITGRRYWRIPTMDGEFLVEESATAVKAIAGGNFLIEGDSPGSALAAARRAVEAITPLPGVITPFPGGVARSGSKVGSRYRGLRASTNDAFCPTLRRRVKTLLHPEARCVYEIIINGLDAAAVAGAMRRGIHAACNATAPSGVLVISAGNYGGNLGKFHFRLHEVLA